MKKLLPILFLIMVLTSGCVKLPEKIEYKYADPDNDLNFIVFEENPKEAGTGTFSLITTEYISGGTYTSTDEAYSLRYAEYPVGVTLKKVTNGIEVEQGVTWELQ